MKSFFSKLGFGSTFGSTAEELPEVLQVDSAALNGAEIAVAYLSSRAGGDFHDFLRVGPTRFLFGLLDVAGRRDANLGVLQAAQACFRSSGEELFAAAELNESDAMIELSRRLNLEIVRAAGGVRSCPAFAGCYNEELGTLCYVNAGHTPGLLRDDSGIVELPATGLPLGLFCAGAQRRPHRRHGAKQFAGGGFTRSGGGRVEARRIRSGRSQERHASRSRFGQ